MPESNGTESTSDPRRRGVLLVAVLVVAIVIAAGAVVVRTIRTVRLEKPFVTMDPVPTDTMRTKLREKFRTGAVRLGNRLADFKSRADTLTPRAARVGRYCDSALVVIDRLVDSLDNALTTRERDALARRAEPGYVALRESVNTFARLVDSASGGPSIDSLDRVFEQLLSE
jgi:hypothetical protein